jgi:hypothetical protein
MRKYELKKDELAWLFCKHYYEMFDEISNIFE